MHLIILTRGKKPLVERFIDELQRIMLPMWMRVPNLENIEKAPSDVINTSGALSDKMMNMVQVAVRPVQLWEVVFPKEHEDLMCASLFDKSRGQTHSKWLIKWFNLFRKLLHLKPINWDYRESPKIDLPHQFVEVIGIGKKEDREIKDDKQGIEFEGI